MRYTWHRQHSATRQRYWNRFRPRVDVLESRVTPAVYTVNTTADTDDGVADAANTTLREAINAANANPGFDEIHFNIPGTGVKTINVGNTGLGDLPQITDAVLIDGYTQPGAKRSELNTGSDAGLLIELNGAAVIDAVAGLSIDAVGVHITGLVINRFTGVDMPASGISAPEDSGAVIEGNFIGTNAAGTVALPNDIGVQVLSGSLGAEANRIGISSVPLKYANVISGNNAEGIILRSNSSVEYNFIGTTAAGDAALPNGGSGVFVLGSNNDIFGNVISANGTNASASHRHGLVLTQDAALGLGAYDPSIGHNDLQFNRIGTDATDTKALGNAVDGIYVEQSTGNQVGAINIIAHNGRNGLTIAGDERTTQNEFAFNNIFANGNLGIDLGNDGPTANDADDADIGPNGLQNFPEIESVTFVRGTLTIRYRVTSTPANSEYPVQVSFYRADPGGQGQLELESDLVGLSHDGQLQTRTFQPDAGEFRLGDFLTATATTSGVPGSTSEFAPAVQSTAKEILVAAVPDLMTNEAGGTAVFTVVLTSRPSADVTITFRSSDETEGTVSPSVLVFTRGNFDRPQTVTVTGVDDADTDGDLPFEIQFDPATSADVAYDTLPLSPVALKNLDDESGDVRVFVRLPASIVPGTRFDYDVVVVNMGAPDTFTVWSDLQSTPPNFVVLERVTVSRRARGRARRDYVAPVSVNLDTGESKTMTYRARALPGSGGAALRADASASTTGNSVFTTVNAAVEAEELVLNLSVPNEVFVGHPLYPEGDWHYRFTITVHNPNAVMATGVTVAWDDKTTPVPHSQFTAGSVTRFGSTYPLAAPGGPYNLGDVTPGETVTIALRALAENTDAGHLFTDTAILTGLVNGATLKSERSHKTEVKTGAVEWLFLAGLAALAGQEWLDQRRRRRKKAKKENDEQDAIDDVFEELAAAI